LNFYDLSTLGVRADNDIPKTFSYHIQPFCFIAASPCAFSLSAALNKQEEARRIYEFYISKTLACPFT